MRLWGLALSLIFSLPTLVGCGRSVETPGLTVFAAASLAESFAEVGRQFESAHPGVAVTFNFAGSQLLAQQLAQGAPADVFASANPPQMNAAIQAGRVVGGTQRIFARNRLVIVYPSNNPGGLSAWQDLARPGLRIVLAASEVPAGQYTLDVLNKAARDLALGAAFRLAVLDNVRSYEQDVRGVLSKVALGEADAGIVYASDLHGKNADEVGHLAIPDALNTVAEYPIAPIKDTRQPDLARAFIDLVLSPSGQAVLAARGFAAESR